VILNKGKVVVQETVSELRRSIVGKVVELTVDNVSKAVRRINEMNSSRIENVNVDSDRNVIRIIVNDAEETLPVINHNTEGCRCENR
jgi:ABC-type multidrug transport system ATPase subunit